MESAGLVRFEGNTRARRYFAVTPVHAPPPATGALALSSEAREVLALVERPLTDRPPVTYRRAFLDDYQPNRTRWIPPLTAQRLRSLGTTGARQQPAGTYARHVFERFLLDLSWNSARLEGNTYSLLDTQRLLAAGESASGASLLETQMLVNHKAAIEYLVNEPVPVLEPRALQAFHALLMENLLGTRVDEGRLRTVPVSITESAFLPSANPQLIDECFRQIVLAARAIDDAFERSFFLLAQLPYLQPFVDGNKRTARLAANLPYVHENLVPLSFTDVPRELFVRAYLALYELRRIEPLRDLFVWAYERSVARLGQVQASVGEPDPFRLRYRDLLREVVALIVRDKVPAQLEETRLLAIAEERLEPEHRLRFVAMAQSELAALHDGNIARYALRPSEFEAWRAVSAR
jgi:fido (protein-threonine AMPylation protein)